MNLFLNTRSKRRTAFTVLLVWMFAMASAWANACLIEVGNTHLHASPGPETLSVQAFRVSPAHLGADADHSENTGAAKSVCLKVCGDGSQSIVKLTSGVDLLDLSMAPPVALAWSAREAAAAPGDLWPGLPAPDPGLPLRIRFSRLAL